MNEFFTGKSASDRGTLFQIKNRFNQRSVKKTVMQCFNSVADLLKLTTEGFVVLLAMKMMNMSSIDDTPNSAPKKNTFRNKKKFLKGVK